MNPSTWVLIGGILGLVSVWGPPRIHPIRDLRQHRQNKATQGRLIEDAVRTPAHEGTVKLLFPEDEQRDR